MDPAMAAVHEEVHAQARAENEDQRQIAQDMGLMLLPQEETGDGKEDQQA
jgi:hypothetical protein